jgi:signal transduction histidine kinase
MLPFNDDQLIILAWAIAVLILITVVIYLAQKIGVIKDKSEKRLNEINRALITSQRINKIILQSLNFDEVVQQISNTIPNQLFFVSGVVAVIDKVKRTIKRIGFSSTKEAGAAVSELNASKVPFNKIEISLDDPNNLMAKAIREKKGFITEDVYDVLGPAITRDEAAKVQRLLGARSTVAYPIYGGKNECIGVFVASTKKKKEDISEYDYTMIQSFIDGVGVAMEHSMLYSDLEKASKELSIANERLKEVDKLKDEFVSLASHELRTPMTIIKSYLWMMLDKNNVSALSEKQRMYIDRAYTSTQRLINLVNDMLNVSRIESGRFTINMKPVDLGELIGTSYSEILPRAHEQKINLEFARPLQVLPKVLADPERVEQILINLIGNSLKFTSENGVIKIAITYDPEMKEEVVSISDNGKGIEPADIVKLFQKFSMVGTNYLVKQNTQGTGLGLYLSKSMITMMNGRIWVESEGLGKGSKFSFSLKTA